MLNASNVDLTIKATATELTRRYIDTSKRSPHKHTHVNAHKHGFIHSTETKQEQLPTIDGIFPALNAIVYGYKNKGHALRKCIIDEIAKGGKSRHGTLYSLVYM